MNATSAPWHGRCRREIGRAGASDRVELLLLNDGNPALASFAPLLAEGEALGLSVVAVVSLHNLGRSRARNRLATLARGQFLLFLSANFCVDRDLYLREPFDEGFVGRGWEDTECAIRVSGQAVIRHFDNPVSHLEQHTDQAWLLRLERSVANYRRLYGLHPDQVRRHRIFRLIPIIGPLGRWSAVRSAVSPYGGVCRLASV